MYARDRIAWVGCAVIYKTPYNDDTMKKKVGKLMPVWGYGRKAVQYVSAAADVMIAWGTHNLSELAEGYKKPLVYVAHGAGAFDRWTARGSISAATHFVSVSKASLDAYRGIVDPSMVTILHNGIDSTRCTITRSRCEVRKELGLTSSEFAVGYLGRLAPEKRPSVIAEAVKLLPKKFRGVWIGDGWDKKTQTAAITKAIGERAILHPRVEDIGNYLQAFDCFVLASPAEGFSMAMLEAMLTGVPLCCTPVGAIPELIEQHGALCEKVPVGCTPRQLAEAIRKVSEMPPQKLKARVTLARKAVKENYLACHMADRWVKYLERIIPPTGDKT